MINKNVLIVIILNTITVALLLTFNWIFLKETKMIFNLINLLSFLMLFLPLVIFWYRAYLKHKRIEEMFTVFMRDFVENIRGGLTVPQAFKLLSTNDYKELTPYIKKMAAQLDWGVPLEDVLLRFSKDVKSKNIARIVSSVIESHRFGGNLADTFQALANVASEIERLRKERQAYLQSQMMTGYVIFFVFLGVMVGIDKFLVPSMGQSTPLVPGQTLVNTQIVSEFKRLFRNLVLIQGFFAGLAVGKISEGSEIAGLKHSLFMMFVGGLVFTFI